MRTLALSLVGALQVTLLVGACGGQPTPLPPPPVSATLECPAPIGRVPKEDCGAVGAEFGEISVGGALKLAGSSKDAESRMNAIRAAGGLGNALREARVALCENYDRCLVGPQEHADRGKALGGLMASLTKLWNARRFALPEDVERFAGAVTALRADFDRAEGKTPPAPVVAPLVRESVKGDALAHLEGAGISFIPAAGAITVTTSDEGPHDVLTTRPETFSLPGGKRFQLEVEGSYAPLTAPLITAGEPLVVRVKYRATKAGDLSIGLRSLEEPDIAEGAQTFHLAADEKGSHEATLTPEPGGSGFYAAIGVRGGACDLDDVEILRGGKPLAAAHAESAAEPYVKTTCVASPTRPIAGKKSFHCEPNPTADVFTFGAPDGYLFLSMRTPSGESTRIKTLSLDGGRNIDATLTQAGTLVIGMIGRGTATIRAVSANEIGVQPR